MKLYLASQKLGPKPELLLNLVGDNKNVCVIANALDDKPLEHRKDRVNKEMHQMKKLGLNPVELDLRDYFDLKDSEQLLYDFLKEKSLVWIRGGNVFLLSRAFGKTGFDNVIKKLVKSNKIVYGGYSAAVILANKSLLGAELVDDINSIPNNYDKNMTLKSLELLDFYLIPHYNSVDDWAVNVKKHVSFIKNHNKKIITMNDNEVYYCEGSEGSVIK